MINPSKTIVISLFSLLFITTKSFAQNVISGSVIDASTNRAVEYVNIGVVGKDIGTVSDSKGIYIIDIDSEFDQDLIMFSCIGYESKSFSVKDLKEEISKDIMLNPLVYELSNVEITSGFMKEKILGNKYKGKSILAGFEKNQKGFECGVFLNIKKSALLKEITCNIAVCTYDSIHYRVNVYKETGKHSFENILKKTIFVKQKIDNNRTSLVIDLSEYNIVVEGNSLVTLEHIEDMGEGKLMFSAGLLKGADCFYRKTSQGNWTKIPVKLGFSVTAKVEE